MEPSKPAGISEHFDIMSGAKDMDGGISSLSRKSYREWDT